VRHAFTPILTSRRTALLASAGLAMSCQAQLVDLTTYWNPALNDNALSSDAGFILSNPGYVKVRVEGRVFGTLLPAPPDTVPLYTWRHSVSGDHYTTSNAAWAPSTSHGSWAYKRLEGYCYGIGVAGTMALQGWYSNSRGDHWATSNTMATGNTASAQWPDYAFAESIGYVLAPQVPQDPEIADSFHFGGMGDTYVLLGERPAVAFLMSYVDQPFHQTNAFFDSWMFGPAFPNVRTYLWQNSQNLFSLSRGAVIGPFVAVDDPDTTGNEASWVDTWAPETSPVFLYVSLRARLGQRFSVTNAGGPSSGVNANREAYEAWERLAVCDLNGGVLTSNDTVAFKTLRGYFLSERAGGLYAEATNRSDIAAHWVISKIGGTGGSEIRSGDTFTLINVATGKYIAATSGGGSTISVTSTTPGLDCQLTMSKEGPTTPGLVRQAADRAGALGLFNPGLYDANGDGKVTQDELALIAIAASANVTSDECGANRWPMPFTVPGSGVTVDLGLAASTNDNVSFATLAHELTHQLGARDINGACCNSYHQTLMSCTCGVGANDASTYHLDPWHRLREGWTAPKIVSLTNPGSSDVLRSLAINSLDDKQPILLFDPRRYDLSTRQGEYFLLEYRNPTLAGVNYDLNTSGRGVAIWHVKTDVDGNTVDVASQCAPSSNEPACFTAGAPGDTHGGNAPWTAFNGSIPLKWIDGTSAGVNVLIAPDGPSSSQVYVEWDPSGVFRPRVDSLSASSVFGGETATAAGDFPLMSTPDDTVALSSASSSFTAMITSWGPTSVGFKVPSSATPGTYMLTVRNGGTSSGISNALQFTVKCYGNCDSSTIPPVLNAGDFSCFLARFRAGDNYANCDGSTAPPLLNAADFTCFLAKFRAGCP